MGEAATIPGVIQRNTSAGNVEGKAKLPTQTNKAAYPPGSQARPMLAPLTNKKNQPSWMTVLLG